MSERIDVTNNEQEDTFKTLADLDNEFRGIIENHPDIYYYLSADAKDTPSSSGHILAIKTSFSMTAVNYKKAHSNNPDKTVKTYLEELRLIHENLNSLMEKDDNAKKELEDFQKKFINFKNKEEYILCKSNPSHQIG